MASKFVSHRQPILVEWNLWQPFRSLAGVKGKPCFFERQEGICLRKYWTRVFNIYLYVKIYDVEQSLAEGARKIYIAVETT